MGAPLPACAAVCWPGEPTERRPMTKDERRSPGTLALGGDLTVGRLGYGAMRLCGPGVWGEPEDPGNAKRVLRRAVELGVDFVDTADASGRGAAARRGC